VTKLQLVEPLLFGDNGIMLSQKNQGLDSWTLLQISQHFRASEKYSYGSYQQLRLILDK